jgi:hypothetical protein
MGNQCGGAPRTVSRVKPEATGIRGTSSRTNRDGAARLFYVRCHKKIAHRVLVSVAIEQRNAALDQAQEEEAGKNR